MVRVKQAAIGFSAEAKKKENLKILYTRLPLALINVLLFSCLGLACSIIQSAHQITLNQVTAKKTCEFLYKYLISKI